MTMPKLSQIQIVNQSGTTDLYLTDAEILKQYTQTEIDTLVEGGYVWRYDDKGQPVESHRDVAQFDARCDYIARLAEARMKPAREARTTFDDIYDRFNPSVDFATKLVIVVVILGIALLIIK